MTATALVTVLAAAVFHALWNTAAKSTQGDSTVFVWMYFTGGALLCAPLVVIQMLREDHAYGWELLLAPAVTAGFHIAYSLLLQTGYRRADMGVVYPVARGTGPLLAVTVAVLALGERLEPLALLGGVAIVAGILVVTGRSLFRRASSLATGLFYGVATGVAIAAYTLWDDFSVNALGITPIVYFGLASTAQSLLMLPWVLRRRDQLAPTWAMDKRQVIVVAVLSPLAYILVLYALTTTSVALVAPIRESSIVIGALLSWWLFRERDPLRRILGAVIVAAGIALMVRG
ncbi:MAG TPA: DMT family transporter [Candidatus Brachybacterium merdavium]|uniref:DMT family transporter n=1 Tax=Candidatus Brachybacterium merdavium TaxID=2838513 RepID=A0A9D2RPJ1_9MICO|nr:DMT family transporter [Candidatus Brachybacterium merdavium]